MKPPREQMAESFFRQRRRRQCEQGSLGTGNGNIYNLVNMSTADGIAALNRFVQNPSGFYVNLHTTINPGGAIRAQLATPIGKAGLAAVAANASTITTVAPGEVAAIYGTNLSPIGSGAHRLQRHQHVAYFHERRERDRRRHESAALRGIPGADQHSDSV